ncbi:MAG: regulatory protein RecX [Pseudomonadota bacterium]
MIDPSSLTQARSSAIGYLSRREHANLELRNKLTRKGFEQSVIDSVLKQLRAENLQSDERFVESYVRTRTHKGFGPLRIQQELRERGISDELLSGVLEADEAAWVTRARLARQKRFGQGLPQGKRELGKQIRFLQSRGFSSSQIRAAI